MANKDYYDDHEPNAIERDRMERREQTRRKSRISSILVIVIAAAVIIGIIVAVVALVGKNKKPADTEPTTVTATIASETRASETTTATTPQSTQPARDPALNNIASSNNADAQQATLPDTSSSSASSDASSQTASSSAAEGNSHSSGNVLHYTATGQTSYGYDWTYSGGGGIVSVSCNYDFNTKQYDFNITGVAPGTASLTLYYNTADGVQQPVNMTVQVDSNLNVTQIG